MDSNKIEKIKTYIIIPNFVVTEELKELATNTINSFRKNSKNIHIIAVDDGSPMDCTFLKELSDTYIKNKENSGFAITCNNGFKWIFENEKDDCYIVCANNDIEVGKGWQEEMIFPFNEWDNVAITGICHCRVKEKEGKPVWEHKDSKVTEGGLNGELMQDGGLWMSKKSVLKKIGIFDEQFIRGGYEDVDLFLRARDTFGMRIIMNARAWYWHKEGATRWNCEQNNYINNFGNESRCIESENLQKFIAKWHFNPHINNPWRSIELIT